MSDKRALGMRLGNESSRSFIYSVIWVLSNSSFKLEGGAVLILSIALLILFKKAVYDGASLTWRSIIFLIACFYFAFYSLALSLLRIIF